MLPEISLLKVTREDVERIAKWLDDDEVCSMWFGRYAYGDPIHLGYIPSQMLKASQDEWDEIFDDPHRRFFSVYGVEGEHIGEAQVVLEQVLGNAELSILIGRKDLWNHGYGTATARALVDLVFNSYRLYRAWVDVPEYNAAALHMFRKLGFVLEGTLRKSRPHKGGRAGSCIMGILASEYSRQTPEVKIEVPAV